MSRQQGGVYEDPNDPNCQPAGISSNFPFNHVCPLVAGGGVMTKDEALDLALEALESCSGAPHWPALQPAVTAIKQARALDKKAENARELGLDYEPVWDNLPSNKDVEDAMRMKRMKRLNQLAIAAAVPDAFGTREGEHPQYIQGWNDCRAEMLRGMKL